MQNHLNRITSSCYNYFQPHLKTVKQKLAPNGMVSFSKYFIQAGESLKSKLPKSVFPLPKPILVVLGAIGLFAFITIARKFAVNKATVPPPEPNPVTKMPKELPKTVPPEAVSSQTPTGLSQMQLLKTDLKQRLTNLDKSFLGLSLNTTKTIKFNDINYLHCTSAKTHTLSEAIDLVIFSLIHCIDNDIRDYPKPNNLYLLVDAEMPGPDQENLLNLFLYKHHCEIKREKDQRNVSWIEAILEALVDKKFICSFAYNRETINDSEFDLYTIELLPKPGAADS